AELGLGAPQDIAYDPANGGLAVVGTTDGATMTLRMTTGGDALTASEPSQSDDGTASAIALVDDGRSPTAADLAAIGVADPDGIAYDARTGTWDVLDGGSQTIVGVVIEQRSVAVTRRTSLRALGAARLQGLARHPHTGELYVAAPEEDHVVRVDEHGAATATYRLDAAAGLDLRAMTFAPSADTTDDPATQHLYVADAGSGRSGGAVRELSLEQDLTLAATVPTVSAQLVRVIATSQFSPASPDPAGIVYIAGRDRMAMVDSEVDETTGAGYHGVNLWQLTRTGTVTDTGSTWSGGANFSREPTGLGYDAATNTLFVSDDAGKRVWLVRPGSDTRFGTADDALTSVNAGAYGSVDTEDPEFDVATGHLFFADGTNKEVYRINPVNGVFGDGNDVMTQLDVEQFGARDPEGLAIHPTRGTLLVGDRATDTIYEITKDGALVRIISTSGIAGLTFISGLATGPASDGSGRTSYWVVDRAVDNGNNSSENDGKIFELRVDDGPIGSPPVAVADSAAAVSGQAATIDVAANDSDPDGNLAPATVTVTAGPGSGTALPNGDGTVTYTPAANSNGSDGFTYRICDTTAGCDTAVVALTVTAVADPPVAVADSASTPASQGVTIDVAANDSDPDGDLAPATVTVTTAPSTGTAVPNGDGTVTYTPAAGFSGSDAFTYRICDAAAVCATATVTVLEAVPYHLSLTDSATLPGIPVTVRDEDIVTYEPGVGWSMLF
ncbi:MAG TPA: tandem-95 repeat protein, partial [Ornithinibacter sp.]|nr:tandem-95 repeat protein [Ornithinibacter sp.]